MPATRPRALVVFAHPDPGSLSAAVRDRVCARLAAAGAEVRQHDLHAEGFDPVLGQAALRALYTTPPEAAPEAARIADLRWCDTLILIYPTWWQGPPAILKGWLDRVLWPGAAFHPPPGGRGLIRPGLTHIRRLAVLTTQGGGRWMVWATRGSGTRAVLGPLRLLCGLRCRVRRVVLYGADAASAADRARHLSRVARSIDALLRR